MVRAKPGGKSKPDPAVAGSPQLSTSCVRGRIRAVCLVGAQLIYRVVWLK